MKHRIFCAFLAAAVIVLSACSAFGEGVKLGQLSRDKNSVEALRKFIRESGRLDNAIMWRLFGRNNSKYESLHYYDNLMSLLMAVTAGEIDEFALPKVVAEYVINTNPEFTVCAATRLRLETSLVFGFREEDGETLRKGFNAALSDMKKYGALDSMTRMYCANPGGENISSVRFEDFPDAATIRVAVTGDLPPVDYVSANGEPAGFNTAILAEIGRRMKVNIKPVQVDTGARTAALMSGRVDVVFWYQLTKGSSELSESLEGVIVSEPYYEFDTMLQVGRK